MSLHVAAWRYASFRAMQQFGRFWSKRTSRWHHKPVVRDTKRKSTESRRVRYTLTAKQLTESVRNRLIREAPATKILTGPSSFPPEVRSNIMQATKRHHLAVHVDVQAVHWQCNLDNVWEGVFDREYFTFSNF
jgi:hypothetical protein